MRISYWSSDVCSSDLHPALEGFHARECMLDESCYVLMTNDRIFSDRPRFLQSAARFKKNARCGFSLDAIATARNKSARSEERRVGKEGVSKGRSRWCRYH